MKTLNTFVLALSAAVLGTTALHAQNRVTADVPFDFTVQSVTLPAGTYAIQSLSSNNGMIRILNLETRKSVVTLASDTLSTYPGKAGESAKLIFHRYGDRYFFAEVWTPNGLRGQAAPSRLERELRAGSTERQMASVALRADGGLR